MKYITECGCSIDPGQAKKIKKKINGEITQKKYCTVCGQKGVVIARENICLDCGCIVRSPMDTGRASKLCKKCAKIRKNVTATAYARVHKTKRKKPKFKNGIRDVHRECYCKMFLTCKRKARKNLCYKCKAFRPVLFGFDPAIWWAKEKPGLSRANV